MRWVDAPLVGLRRLLACGLESLSAEQRCKRLVRPDWDLAHWCRDGLHGRPWPAPAGGARGCARLHVSQGRDLDLSQPAILAGALGEWPRPELWSLEALLREYSEAEFTVGATEAPAGVQDAPSGGNGSDFRAGAVSGLDGHGSEAGGESSECGPVAVKMKLREYCEYSQRQRDDCPLYIFDDSFLDTDAALVDSYARPSCFAEDLMGALGDGRPPHRWLLIGAPRSGTEPHVDPLQTAAWNTLVSGRKRWVCFPPSATAPQLRLLEQSDTCDSAVHWLHGSYPAVEAAASSCLDFVQHPGEAVYVPHGWWHAVVNLEFSVAVTHNFVGRHNLGASHAKTREEDPELAGEWLAAMRADPSLPPCVADLLARECGEPATEGSPLTSGVE